jgi:hypothetical protein
MTIDRYTKGVLTVIAGCLLFQCAMMAGKVIDAQQPASPSEIVLPGHAQPVVIVGWGEMTMRGEVALNMKRPPTGPATTDITLPVRLSNGDQQPLPVAIMSRQPLPVALAPPSTLAYSPDHPLPVAITGIRKATDQWDTINTRVEPQPMQATPGAVKP